jgi:fatty-acid desaturase
VKALTGKALKFQKGAVLVITVAPFAGLLFAVWSLWGWGLSGVDAGIFLATYVLSGLGVTVGFHRLLTHKSFETKPWLRALLAIAGSLAIEGSVISWVAAHRRHHAFSDREGDPHSPHLVEDDSLRGVIKGLWHAQMGWLFTADLGGAISIRDSSGHGFRVNQVVARSANRVLVGGPGPCVPATSCDVERQFDLSLLWS